MVMKHLRNLIDTVKGGRGAQQNKDAAGASKQPDVINIDMKEPEAGKGKLALEVKKLESFSDTEAVLESLRGGRRLLLIKITALKEKDMAELKRAINRFKTHCAATGADLAAIDDNWIILVPPIVGLERV